MRHASRLTRDEKRERDLRNELRDQPGTDYYGRDKDFALISMTTVEVSH